MWLGRRPSASPRPSAMTDVTRILPAVEQGEPEPVPPWGWRRVEGKTPEAGDGAVVGTRNSRVFHAPPTFRSEGVTKRIPPRHEHCILAILSLYHRVLRGRERQQGGL